MKLYPLVLDLENKICTFIGGGNLIYKKIKDIQKYNCKIFVFSNYVIPELKNEIESNKSIIFKKSVNYEILLKSLLIFVSDENVVIQNETKSPLSYSEISSVIKFSEKYSKLLCFLDQPKYCNFFNTHIFEKDPILISISTSGAAPMIGNYIKHQLDNIISDDLVLLTKFLAKFRSKIVSQIPDPEKRKQFYNKIIDSKFIEILKKNEEEALGKLFQYIVEFL